MSEAKARTSTTVGEEITRWEARLNKAWDDGNVDDMTFCEKQLDRLREELALLGREAPLAAAAAARGSDVAAAAQGPQGTEAALDPYLASVVEARMFYRWEAAPKSTRAFLNELTENLKTKLFSEHGLEFSDRVTFGDLYEASIFDSDPKEDETKQAEEKRAKAAKIRNAMEHEEWEYLCSLDRIANNHVQNARLKDPVSGVRTMVCPAENFDPAILMKVAADFGMVADRSKLFVKPDDELLIPPPMRPASSLQPPSPQSLGKPRTRDDAEGERDPKQPRR